MVYFESVTILSGHLGGTALATRIMAVISLAWFDWFSPGTLMVQFHGLLGPTHIPLPLLAFAFPLLKHAPSM